MEISNSMLSSIWTFIKLTWKENENKNHKYCHQRPVFDFQMSWVGGGLHVNAQLALFAIKVWFLKKEKLKFSIF